MILSIQKCFLVTFFNIHAYQDEYEEKAKRNILTEIDDLLENILKKNNSGFRFFWIRS